MTSTAIERLRKYMAECEDAPNWGGPTMLPARPAIEDLRAVLDALTPSASYLAGMKAAAEICGTLAETTYDAAPEFDAVLACEAAIMDAARETAPVMTTTTRAAVERLREAIGFDPMGFVEEARMHLKQMPNVVQRDYLRAALEKIERTAFAITELTPPAAPEIPAGMVEPTEAMVDAFENCPLPKFTTSREDTRIALRAALAAYTPTARPSATAADMAAFGASDAACYHYPGEDQQAERAAFCAGAAHSARPAATAGEVERVALKGRGFDSSTGGFTELLVGDRAFGKHEVIAALASDRGEIERLREALRLARPIVEAELEEAEGYADADWEGMTRQALEAIDAALSEPEKRDALERR